MATLVLTTIGSVVGGPIGGAIGAVIGRAVDQRVFAPKGRRGPRLGDISVQTSSYGSAIPKLFGTIRVAGTVIWATDLAEAQQSGGGGKGRPATTTYSYSASFAVALSGRPIRAVRRIWADGKLLRGAAGDWKTHTGFRLYFGDEDQAVDPLIAYAEGIGGCPAYRGIAYAVFEDLQLADFGNRIPSLTFEVEADEEAVPVGRIVEALSGGAVAAISGGVSVNGYAASGDSVRGAAEVLAGLGGLSMRDDGRVLCLGVDDEAFVPRARDLDASAAPGDTARMQIERVAAGALPDEIALSYYEPARDYQAGLQRARRGGPGRRVENVDVAAALPAEAAKAAAERRLAQAWAARTQATLALPLRALGLQAGSRLQLPDGGAAFHVSGWTLEHMVMKLQLVGVARASADAPADPGRPTSEIDQAAGATIVAVLDLPPLDEVAVAPQLWIAAGSRSPGWRSAQLLASLDDGASFQAIGRTAQKAVIGTVRTALPMGEPALFDRRHAIDVELADATTWLESRSDDALIAGANAAMIGGELIQFGQAQPIGFGRFRLRTLLRGRRGTEDAMGSHVAGERFVLIDQASLKAFGAPVSAIGARVRIAGIGVGDSVAIEDQAIVTARALRPPSPVHVRVQRLPAGGIRIGWTRRSRSGWSWLDGTDTPIGEEFERYRVSIDDGTTVARTVETAVPWFDYAPDEQAADALGGIVGITVVQLGAVAASGPSQRIEIIF